VDRARKLVHPFFWLSALTIVAAGSAVAVRPAFALPLAFLICASLFLAWCARPSFPSLHLVENGMLFLAATVALMVVVRLVMLATAGDQPEYAGQWQERETCPHISCLVSPDSSRYAGTTGFFSQHPAASLEDGATYLRVRNGVFFSAASAEFMRLGLTSAEGNAAVAFLSAVLLVMLVRRWFLSRGLPLLPVALFACSSPILYFGNLNLKETTDALLLLAAIMASTRLRTVWLAPLPLVGLYYDRSYYIWIALAVIAGGRLYVPRGHWTIRRICVYLALLVGAAWYALGALRSQSVFLDLHQSLNPGGAYLSLGEFARGSFQSLFVPASPRLSGLLDAPMLACYGLVGFAAWRRKSWLPLLHPCLVAFVGSLMLFGVVYGGNFRAREALSFLLVIGTGEALSTVEVSETRRFTPLSARLPVSDA
jgi:hypothetical protein